MRYPNYAFMLVGDCRVGKTTLADIISHKMKMRVLIIRSLTTRAPREESDARFYTHISMKRFEEKIANEDLAECVRYGENYYGYERAQLEHVLRSRHGICVATQEGANELLKLGYNVKPVRIIGKNNEHIQRPFYAAHPERKADDERRNMIPVPYAHILVNDFTPGGLKKAVRELIAFIRKHK